MQNTFQKKKKIVFVHHKISYGGANKMLTFVANTLASEGKYEVTVHTYASDEAPSYELHKSIKVIKESHYTSLKNIYKLPQFLKVNNVIKTIKPDLVISFMSTNNFFSILSVLFKPTKVIISERGNPKSENSLFSKMKLMTYGLSDGVVFQTEGAKSFFSKKVQLKGVIIENPVIKPDIEIKSWDQRKKTIAFVGRFDIIQKRQDIAIKAFALINKTHPDYKLVFYGDGDGLNEMKDLVKELSLDEVIEFKGMVDNVIEEISNSRIFLLTSDFEGVPNALIEAMSLGLPCISTDCDPGGARLLISNNNNGILVSKGDIHEIYEAVNKMIEMPDFANELGNNAKEISSIFSEVEIKNKWLSYINNTIK